MRTLAVQPTLDQLAALGLLVLIRTFLSFALEAEINGVAPWRRWQVSGARASARPTPGCSDDPVGAAAAPAGAPQADGGGGTAGARSGSGSGSGSWSTGSPSPDSPGTDSPAPG